MAYHVKIRKNGACYGTLGPYGRRADALTDAAVLKAPGITVEIAKGNPQRSKTHLTRRNSAAATAVVTQLALRLAKAGVKSFLDASPDERVRMLRAKTRFNIPYRLALRDDRRAHMIAGAIAKTLGAEEKRLAANPKRRNRGMITIHRDGYERKGYHRKDGTWVAPTCVKASTFKVKDQGNAGVTSRGAEQGKHKGSKPWITHEGKLGGPGFLSKKIAPQKRILSGAVRQWGYRSTLGSIMVLARVHDIESRHGKRLRSLRRWLVDTYGGPGSFGPRG